MLARACGFRDAWEAASAAMYSIRIKEEVTLGLMRCLFENPFRAAVFDPAWAFTNDSAALQLARAIGQTGGLMTDAHSGRRAGRRRLP